MAGARSSSGPRYITSPATPTIVRHSPDCSGLISLIRCPTASWPGKSWLGERAAHDDDRQAARDVAGVERPALQHRRAQRVEVAGRRGNEERAVLVGRQRAPFDRKPYGRAAA